jgi:DNA-binding response OmpR family regulator
MGNRPEGVSPGILRPCANETNSWWRRRTSSPNRTNDAQKGYGRPMEIRVLGPLEVADNGRILALGSGRQLALVGLLLLNRNEVVSTEQLVDRLWEKPPPSASKIIRNYVSLLRKELGDRLVTKSPG